MRWLVAILLILPGLAYAQNVLDTGAILTEVFDDGFVGTDPSFAGIGFDFNGDNGLFVGEALVGINGDADSIPYGGSSEFTNVSPTAAIAPGGIFSYFDTGWATSFSSPLGVTLHQEAYALSGSNDQFVVFNLCAENTSGGDLDVFLGYFADWDVGGAGGFSNNLGDAAGDLVYTWEDGGANSPNFFGYSPLMGDVLSGWTVDSSVNDAGMYVEMTTPGVGGTPPADKRNVMGVDVGTISNGGIQCAIFAWVAGANLAALQSAIAAAEVAIPVELLSFDAILDGRNVSLRWATASETNNAGFEVQMDAGSGFQALGFVNGHGTTTEAQTYSFAVRNLDPGTYVFRLKQIDFDGAFEYHGDLEVSVETPDRYVLMQAYPNPFNPEATVRFAVRDSAPVTLTLHDALGRQVSTLYSGTPEANQTLSVRIDGSGLPSGLYLVRLTGNGFSASQAVTLLK